MIALVRNPKFALCFSAFICMVLYLAGIYTRPLFPVDETRYLGVAWEMYASKNFLVPHLNFQPYDHKPPLLFWCLNILWALFGVSQEAAMVLPLISAFILVACTQRLAGKLVPGRPELVAHTTYILIGFLPFVIYSNMVMFDILLAIFIITGLTAVWDYTKSGSQFSLRFLTLSAGLGLLTKGPVIFLHLLAPVLLARFWNKQPNIQSRIWRRNIGLSFLFALVIGLSWAVPASIYGGADFSDRIFWGQTAGRVANAFDHKQAFWWYLPFLPLLLCPWILSPLIWKSLKDLPGQEHRQALSFLASWLLPVFISFCFISGKQIHYLLPLFPGLSIILAIALGQVDKQYSPRFSFLPYAAIAFFLSLPLAAKFLGIAPLPADILDAVSYAWGLAGLLLVLALFWLGRRNRDVYIISVSLCSLVFIVNMEFQAKNGLFKRYDLRPVAEVLMRNPNPALAFTRNYHGEWSFLARLDRPVRQMDVEDTDMYLKYFPDSLIFVRTEHPEEVTPYDIIFSMPYKIKDTYYIIVKRGTSGNYAK